ncbi:MAG: site-2 protease family protein [Clostridia bacterium]|nr:site-2 protease family protein [Clostridia bacterium]
MKYGFVKAIAAALLLFLILSLLRGSEYLMIALIAAAIHESGHLAAAKILSVPRDGGGAGLFGLSLKFDFSAVPYYKEFIVCISGAIFNITACLITVAAVKDAGDHATFFIFTNLSLALFNLLPVSPLDGSGVLRAVLSAFLNVKLAERIVTFVSAGLSLAFFVFCVYVQIKIGVNLSLMMISVFLIHNAFKTVKGRTDYL